MKKNQKRKRLSEAFKNEYSPLLRTKYRKSRKRKNYIRVKKRNWMPQKTVILSDEERK